LEAEGVLLTRHGSGQYRAAARTSGSMEVHVMGHPAVFVILQIALDGIADTHTNEGAGHAGVEGPEAEGAARVEVSFQLDGLQVDAYRLRLPAGDRGRNVGRIM